MQEGVKYICQNLHDTTFVTPDGKFLIHVDYLTASQETHEKDKFNPHQVDHYFRTVDQIKSVSIEPVAPPADKGGQG